MCKGSGKCEPCSLYISTYSITDTFADNLQQAKYNTPLWNSAKVLLPVCLDLL